MAQDPESSEELQDEGSIDPSHDLDMVPLYSSKGVDAEMEADIIHGVLESNGIPSMVISAPGTPIFGFEVHVPRARREEAQRVIAEAESTGPDGAAEAEAASEDGK